MKNGNLYKLLFDNMLNGFAHCKIVYEDGKAVDWMYLVVNPAFEQQTGLKNAAGKLGSELVPGIHTLDPELLEIYRRVAETLIPICFTRYVTALRDWFEINVFSHERGTFTAVFDVVTHRKQMEQKLEQKHVALVEAYDQTISGWAQALELRNRETKGHSVRVVEKTVMLARRMGVDEAKIVDYRRGALLHDIGKMGIPDSILLKDGQLTEDERATMSLHPELAYILMKPIKFLETSMDIPYCHHEAWDGSGYPRGLKGKAIPLAARIFSVIDVYDAMISDRVYRQGLGQKIVLDHIKEQSGRLFDPAVVEKFIELVGENGSSHE